VLADKLVTYDWINKEGSAKGLIMWQAAGRSAGDRADRHRRSKRERRFEGRLDDAIDALLPTAPTTASRCVLPFNIRPQ